MKNNILNLTDKDKENFKKVCIPLHFGEGYPLLRVFVLRGIWELMTAMELCNNDNEFFGVLSDVLKGKDSKDKYENRWAVPCSYFGAFNIVKPYFDFLSERERAEIKSFCLKNKEMKGGENNG